MELKDPSPIDDHALPQRALRPSWFRRETISLADVAVQIFAVVLGILLALSINGWNENREIVAKVAAAQTAIRAEVRTNADMLKKTVAYHTALAKAVAATVAGPTPPQHCYEVPSWRGLQTALIVRGAYDNAIASGVFTQMNPAEGRNIAAVYALQGRYVTFSDMSLNWLVVKYMDQPSGCAQLLEGLSESGSTLMTSYDSYLASAATTP